MSPTLAQEVQRKQAELPETLPTRPSETFKVLARPTNNFSRGQKLSVSASQPARPTIEPRILMTNSSVRPRVPVASSVIEVSHEMPAVAASEVEVPKQALFAVNDEPVLDCDTNPARQRARHVPPRRLSSEHSPSPARRVPVRSANRHQLAAFQDYIAPDVAPETSIPQENTTVDTDVPDALSDLHRPVSGIDLRQATEIPTLAEGDSPSLRQPLDLAQTLAGRRSLLDLSVSDWREWSPDRDSYPFCHFPLYFEDPNLERCGRGWFCFTTVASIGHFACNTALLPVHLIMDPPRRYVRTLPDCPACHRFYWDFDLP